MVLLWFMALALLLLGLLNIYTLDRVWKRNRRMVEILAAWDQLVAQESENLRRGVGTLTDLSARLLTQEEARLRVLSEVGQRLYELTEQEPREKKRQRFQLHDASILYNSDIERAIFQLRLGARMLKNRAHQSPQVQRSGIGEG